MNYKIIVPIVAVIAILAVVTAPEYKGVKLKIVPIDGGNGPVTPTDETVRNGLYPLSRPLFIYVNNASLRRPEVKAFVSFYMTNAEQLVAEVGYTPFDPSVYQDNLQKLNGLVTLTQQLSGTIEIDGSSTVFPITQAVAEKFMKEYPNMRVIVGVSGTGGGFKRFVRGEIEINDASRPISYSEALAATQNGVQYIEFKVAIDGLAVVVHSSNTWVDYLTVQELNMTWRPGSTVYRWSDIRKNWPDEPIHLYGPGTDSGTFDYFTEVVVGTAKASRPDYTASEDDNVLVQGVLRDPYALGYFGYAYYKQHE